MYRSIRAAVGASAQARPARAKASSNAPQSTWGMTTLQSSIITLNIYLQPPLSPVPAHSISLGCDSRPPGPFARLAESFSNPIILYSRT